jgi:molybdate transport system substrate-binding protein
MRTIVFLYLLVAAPVWAGEPIRIAVAANFKPTLQKITEPFLANSGIVVTYSSASTGALTTQIVNGAPYDIFFAADSETTKTILAAPGHEQDQIFCYARGSLVLAGGNGKLSALANPNLSLAIANPATAPYGRAAREVLARPEFSAGEGRKLVRGNSAAQAYQFWEGGSVKMALLPRALVLTGATPIPSDWHGPLDQHAIVLRQNASVDAYLHWLRSDAVRAQIIAAGYDPCP